MTLNQNSTHQDVVILWEEKNIKNLENDLAIQVFGNAIHCIERRCLITLSSVTLQVVLDRIIHQGIEKFPILVEITLEKEGINFTKIIQKKDHYKIGEIQDAFRYLLIEILTVIGNLTSDVLTTPLHKELMEVTSESALKVHAVQSLRTINTVKKRGGK
ncbi:MAG: hypothetical protein K2Q18_16210 [Bdellovibrionales bacterium]|nr:hypothetical protein [Bdellovibrionales bacterium]